MVSDSPTMQEFTPLLRTVQTLPPTTRHQLLQALAGVADADAGRERSAAQSAGGSGQ